MAAKYSGSKSYLKKDGIKITIDYDFTGIKTLKANINKLNNRHVKWGWINKRKHKGSGYYVAQLAYMQEFGSTSEGKNIPARPYFRQSIDMIKSADKPNVLKVVQAMLSGGDIDTPLAKFGYDNKQAFHKSVMKQNMQKLSPHTVKTKGHSFQWDDTGEMLHAFDFKVFKSSLTKAERQADN